MPRLLALLLVVLVGCADKHVAPSAAATKPDSGSAGEHHTLLDAAAASGKPDTGLPEPDATTSSQRLDASTGTPRAADAQPSDAGVPVQPADAAIDPPQSDAAAPSLEAEVTTPPALEALPSCTPSGLSFATPPPTPARGGQLSISLSAVLQPRAAYERAEVQVLTNNGDVDETYSGALSWTLPDGVTLLSSSPVVAGEGEATFRFMKLGNVRVSATLSNDARSGFAETTVYATQLPVWELDAEPKDLKRILADPESTEEITAYLVIDGVEHPTLVRLHGGSSRHFPKKSFRFELTDMDPVTETYGRKLILRSEYNDKSLLRNWLALRMFRVHTQIPTPGSQLVNFRINGRYYGVMHNVERVASHLLERWGLSKDGSLYEADPEEAFSSPGGNLSKVTPPEDYPHVYQHQAGLITDYSDLRALIEDTLTLPDAKLTQVIERELRVDDYLDYLAMMATLQNHDHVRKNFYLYRNPLLSGGWRVVPWDLDLSFGHLWTEANEVLEEQIYSDSDIFVGVKAPERGSFYNQLIDRVLTLPNYRTRFRARLEALIATGLTRAAAETMLDNIVCRATPDILADTQKRASNAEYLARVAEIGAFIEARASYIHAVP